MWLYATLDGISSARKLEELCKYHEAYKWIAGGVPINRTMLAEFRSANPEMFDELLTQSLAVMVYAGLIPREDIAQDGTRSKANAGKGSCHRLETLQQLQKEVQTFIKRIAEENQKDPNAADKKKQTMRLRASKERLDRIRKAQEELKKAQAEKIENRKKRGKGEVSEQELKEVRASTVDPEARKMKMADGSFRVAYNTQFATGMTTRVIYGVSVVNKQDPGTLLPMMRQLYARFTRLGLKLSGAWAADSAYSSKENIDGAAAEFPDCSIYAPAKANSKSDPTVPKKGDSAAVIKWRQRLNSEEMKEVYQNRCSSAEFSNAQTKNMGLSEFPVRGLKKALGVATLLAMAHNLHRYWDLKKKALFKMI